MLSWQGRHPLSWRDEGLCRVFEVPAAGGHFACLRRTRLPLRCRARGLATASAHACQSSQPAICVANEARSGLAVLAVGAFHRTLFAVRGGA
jgi:hypothetical protein